MYFSKRLLTQGFLLSIVALSGCATIVSSDSQDVMFNSEPADAEVLVNGVSVGQTPLTYKVKRAEGTTVTVRKEGFQDSTTSLTTQTNGMFWGNILFGGLPGSTTDSMTGAMYEYSPGQYMITLQPNS